MSNAGGRAGGRPAGRGGRPALPAPTLHDLLWWGLAAGIAVAAAQLFWTVVTPVSPLGDWRPAGVRTMPAAARSALLAGFDPFNRGAPAAPATAAETITQLPLTLFGTRFNPATGTGSAIVAGSDGAQQIYRIGEEVMPGAVLSAIAFDHVVITRAGAPELLYLDQSQPADAASPTGAPGTAPPARAGNPLSADAVRRGITFSPHAAGGGISGIAVSPGGDGAAFRAAGFQPGDIVTAIGGERINDPADVARLAGMIAPGANLAVTVERDGRTVPLSLTVAP